MLCPWLAAMTADQAAKLKASLPNYVWDGQYQQRPTAGGSGMLSVERFQRFDLSKPPKFELSIHSWDVGATIGGNASVCTKWGLAPNRDKKDALYLTQVISVRLELPEVLARSKPKSRKTIPLLSSSTSAVSDSVSFSTSSAPGIATYPGPTRRGSRSKLDRPRGLDLLTRRSNALAAQSSGSKTGKC
mgnify:CR=1 FL=1|jgi:hypothetical protein